MDIVGAKPNLKYQNAIELIGGRYRECSTVLRACAISRQRCISVTARRDRVFDGLVRFEKSKKAGLNTMYVIEDSAEFA
jgi:hypothetical protein